MDKHKEKGQEAVLACFKTAPAFSCCCGGKEMKELWYLITGFNSDFTEEFIYGKF
jgi:hypothetical protein